ncbi:Acetyl-coenzyme A carboxylase carboxyl transferase subunit beta [Labeo rohita]|uniref:Acetyl-coenzyme A carboxylase carboxyl transferase subunit beta n=1 Tax=Labeo rohita TaxID=84645 RepID=A0ABQ8LVS6_LABRO|nr:Acetyl-coenzyme A carboxylase carboxyl transferase subunit beta [Labeo rohita]
MSPSTHDRDRRSDLSKKGRMEVAVCFSTLACRDLPFVEFAREFCGLAMMSGLDDATINSLFWIGANYSSPVDLPDTTGLSWREGILRCLERVWLQSRTSPPDHPEPSQRTPRLAEPEPKPTMDRAESDRAITKGSDSAVDRYSA